MPATKSTEEMLTAAKWAAQFNIPQSKFKKAIQDLKIEADLVKAGCNYYSRKTIEKVLKATK
jgi:hypothetical protein